VTVASNTIELHEVPERRRIAVQGVIPKLLTFRCAKILNLIFLYILYVSITSILAPYHILQYNQEICRYSYTVSTITPDLPPTVALCPLRINSSILAASEAYLHLERIFGPYLKNKNGIGTHASARNAGTELAH
jgi:hypothetical protein